MKRVGGVHRSEAAEVDQRRGRTVTGANVGTPRKRSLRYMGTVAREPQFAEVIDRSRPLGAHLQFAEAEPTRERNAG